VLLQRFLFALITLVQRHNMTGEGASMQNYDELELRATKDNADVHVVRVVRGQ
jgi:hypothetical protein